MPGYRVDDLKRIYQSLPNLVFVAVMIFISLAFSPAYLFLLFGGELGLLLISGTAPVQRLLQSRAEQERRHEQRKREEQIQAELPANYRADFGALDCMAVSSVRVRRSDLPSRTTATFCHISDCTFCTNFSTSGELPFG